MDRRVGTRRVGGAVAGIMALFMTVTMIMIVAVVMIVLVVVIVVVLVVVALGVLVVVAVPPAQPRHRRVEINPGQSTLRGRIGPQPLVGGPESGSEVGNATPLVIGARRAFETQEVVQRRFETDRDGGRIEGDGQVKPTMGVGGLLRQGGAWQTGRDGEGGTQAQAQAEAQAETDADTGADADPDAGKAPGRGSSEGRWQWHGFLFCPGQPGSG